jgi:hypothetical protein
MIKHMSGTRCTDDREVGVTLCVVCTMHKETRSVGFLVWPQNHGQWFLLVWPQNQWLRVSRFRPQN